MYEDGKGVQREEMKQPFSVCGNEFFTRGPDHPNDLYMFGMFFHLLSVNFFFFLLRNLWSWIIFFASIGPFLDYNWARSINWARLIFLMGCQKLNRPVRDFVERYVPVMGVELWCNVNHITFSLLVDIIMFIICPSSWVYISILYIWHSFSLRKMLLLLLKRLKKWLQIDYHGRGITNNLWKDKAMWSLIYIIG